MHTPQQAEHIASLLRRSRAGSRDAEKEAFDLLYPELHRIACRTFRTERPGHTLQATILVSEVYLRVLRNPEIAWQGPQHVYAVAARTMRRILLDYARSRRAQRRPAAASRVPLEDHMAYCDSSPVDIIALDTALTRLENVDRRRALVVEMRCFADLSLREAAAVLGVGERTVKEDWRVGCAWLRRELGEPLQALACGAN